MKPRDKLIYYSLISKGDYFQTLRCVHEMPLASDEEILEAVGKIKCQTVTMLDEDYPQSLLRSPNPPLVLYYYGDLSLAQDIKNNIAVIGSRDCSEYGVMMTKRLVSEIARKMVIVSGMAIGIDTVGQVEAIENHGKTIAVLPCGIDSCYPLRNESLYEIIKKDHLLISEYPFDTIPDQNCFRMRNRIIAGLADSLLVTEAKNNSGTLITIGFALMQGKDIFAVPYPAGEGSHCNRLIQEGALLVERGSDILYERNLI